MTDVEYRHLRRLERIADAIHFKIMLYGHKPEYVPIAVMASELRGELNRILNGAPLPALFKELAESVN